jgi:hypothetical protein
MTDTESESEGGESESEYEEEDPVYNEEAAVPKATTGTVPPVPAGAPSIPPSHSQIGDIDLDFTPAPAKVAPAGKKRKAAEANAVLPDGMTEAEFETHLKLDTFIETGIEMFPILKEYVAKKIPGSNFYGESLLNKKRLAKAMRLKIRVLNRAEMTSTGFSGTLEMVEKFVTAATPLNITGTADTMGKSAMVQNTLKEYMWINPGFLGDPLSQLQFAAPLFAASQYAVNVEKQKMIAMRDEMMALAAKEAAKNAAAAPADAAPPAPVTVPDIAPPAESPPK